MECFDAQKMAAFEATLIASEQSSGRILPDRSGIGLTEAEWDWLAAGHFFAFSPHAINHPDPIVSGLARLQKAQQLSAMETLPTIIHNLWQAIDCADANVKETIGASALLSIARVGLRCGAWQLLGKVLGQGLAWSRLRPQKRRLSVASGLVAEWALASGETRVAFTYARESLRHGAETQRIKGYLGFAHALADNWSQAFLFFREALASQKAQAVIHDRSAFGEANLIKAYALKAMNRREMDCLQHAKARFSEAAESLTSVKSTFPINTAALSIAYAEQALQGTTAIDTKKIIQDIEMAGRWRDCIFFARMGQEYAGLPDRIHAIIRELDALAQYFPEVESLVDEVLTYLPKNISSIAPTNRNSLPRALFCI